MTDRLRELERALKALQVAGRDLARSVGSAPGIDPMRGLLQRNWREADEAATKALDAKEADRG